MLGPATTTQEPLGDAGVQSPAAAMVSALAQCGLSDRDRRHLRFFFEAASLRVAVELAGELRKLTPDAVYVRPAPLRLLTRRRWTVALTTPPAPLSLGAIELWEREMREVAHGRPGCRFVCGTLLLTLEDTDQRR